MPARASDADRPSDNGGCSGDRDIRGLRSGDEIEVVLILGERGILLSNASCFVFRVTLFSYNVLHAADVRLSSAECGVGEIFKLNQSRSQGHINLRQQNIPFSLSLINASALTSKSVNSSRDFSFNQDKSSSWFESTPLPSPDASPPSHLFPKAIPSMLLLAPGNGNVDA